MKTRELIKLLEDGNPNDEIVVAIDKSNNRFGTSPSVGIVHLYHGFHWDQGKTYIVCNLDLTTVKRKDEEDCTCHCHKEKDLPEGVQCKCIKNCEHCNPKK